MLQAFVTCPKGIEALLAEELQQLGAENIKQTTAGVSFAGSEEAIYRVCYWSRLANRVLLPIAEFKASNWEEYYLGIKRIDWNEHFSVKDTFAIQVTIQQSVLNNSLFAAQKAKDAIADQFRERTGSRPSIELNQPDIQFNIHIEKEQVVVNIDLCGESLHRRGYRSEAGEAPLKENLAAAILLRANWPKMAEKQGELLDPMCGSGTFLIEAALMTADIAPGLLREYYSCFGWKKFNPNAWRSIRDEAMQRREQGMKKIPRITGYDDHSEVVTKALANIERAGLTGYIHVERRALAQCRPRGSDARVGLVIVNPPYGVRLGELSSLRFTYQYLGEILKQHFIGWQASVFTGNADLAKALRLGPDKIYQFYNGEIKCQLLNFHIRERVVQDGKAESEPKPHIDIENIFSTVAGSQDFANRLQKNIQALKKWRVQENVTCYRLYDADLPDFAMAIDVYSKGEEVYCYVQEYAPPKTVSEEKALARLLAAMDIIKHHLQIDEEHLIVKTRQRQKGVQQYEKLAENKKLIEINEGQARFILNLTDYLDTGLFLDTRLVRQLIYKEAASKHFLNLFCYTGTASVWAALGKAASTTSVDMSRVYLDWAKQNMAINGLSPRGHYFIQADCLQWLGEARDKYDLILLDPPTFSNSKRMKDTLDVQRDHEKLIQQCMNILKRDGKLIFVTNKRNFKLAEIITKKYRVTEITHKTLPLDFKRGAIHHSYIIQWGAE